MQSSREILTKFNRAITSCVGSAAKVFIEFTGTKMEYPLTHVHISTGVKNSKIYFAMDENAIEQKVHELTIEATICAPKKVVGYDFVSIMDGIITAAFLEDMPKVIEIHTDKAKYDSTLGAIVQSVYITVQA